MTFFEPSLESENYVITPLLLITFLNIFCFPVIGFLYYCCFQKQGIKKSVLQCGSFVLHHLLFLMAQILFIYFIFLFPRNCSDNICKENMNIVKNKFDKFSSDLVKKLDTINQTSCKQAYDLCEIVPDIANSTCNNRIGNDLSCGCFGRRIWYDHAGWFPPIPDRDDPRYCYSEQGDYLFKDFFNELGNLGVVVSNFFISFGGKTTKHLDYPLRFITNEIYLPILDLNCLSIDLNNTLFHCINHFDPKEQVYWKAQENDKRMDFSLLYDISKANKKVNDLQKEALDILFNEVFYFNDLFNAYKYCGDNSVYEIPEFNHLSPKNINGINKFLLDGFNISECDTEYTNIYTPILQAAENQKNPDYSIYDDSGLVIFVHGKMIYNYTTLNSGTSKLFLVIFGEHVQEHGLCKLAERSGGGCVIVPTDTDFDKVKFLNESSSIVEKFINQKNSTNVRITYPRFDPFEKHEVLTFSVNLNEENEEAVIMGLKLNWNLTSVASNCQGMETIYRLQNLKADISWNLVTVCIVMNSYLILSMVLFFVVETFRFIQKNSSDEEYKCCNCCCVCCRANLNFFLAIFEEIVKLNKIGDVCLFGICVALYVNIYEFSIATYVIVGAVIFSYFLLYLCGVCFLKVQKFKNPKKKKEKGKESYRSVNKAEITGLSLMIRKIVFDDFITGSFNNIKIKSGELIGIMGHSGAGKSTFFNILLSNYQPKDLSVNVELNVDGKIISSKLNNVQRLSPFIGYVPQEEILPQKLTVFEILLSQVRQKYKEKYSGASNELIEWWTDQLDMTGKLRDQFPNELSGGQLKRLSVLKELVGCPPIILCDEPTSGLDSISAEKLMEKLKSLAQLGLAIVVVIHQPSTEILQKLDKLYLFLKDKDTVKCAEVDTTSNRVTVDMVDTYLKNPDPYLEDSIIAQADISINGDEVNNVDVLSKLNKQTGSIHQNFFVKWFYLFPRCCMQEIRDVTGIGIDFLVIFCSALSIILVFNPMHSFVGRTNTEIETCLKLGCGDIDQKGSTCSSEQVLYGCAFPRLNPIFLQEFMITFCVGLVALITSLRIFGEEKKNLIREFRSGVNAFQYFITKMIVHTPRMIVSVFLFLLLVYGSNCLKAPFRYYYVVAFILYAYVTGMGIFASLLCKVFVMLSIKFY